MGIRMKIELCKDIDWMLSKEAFLIYASCMYQPTFDDYKKMMEDVLSDPSRAVYVCVNKDERAGIILLKLLEDAAEIIGIAVSEKQRNQGIGKQMIRSVLQYERLERLEAQTDEDAIGFYRKCGFNDERIIIDYPDGSAVRYNCVLSN